MSNKLMKIPKPSAMQFPSFKKNYRNYNNWCPYFPYYRYFPCYLCRSIEIRNMEIKEYNQMHGSCYPDLVNPYCKNGKHIQ